VPKLSIVASFVPVLLGLCAASIVAHAEGPKPCVATTFAVSAVASACKSGGQPAAKAVMKQVVDKAKASGASVNCKTCHTDLTSFTLTANATADLKKWL
jgi:predicted CxxxxCH...CXXCH cytochrome family protein